MQASSQPLGRWGALANAHALKHVWLTSRVLLVSIRQMRSIIGSAYAAKYAAQGDMTFRAPTSATTPAGVAFGYDNEGGDLHPDACPQVTRTHVFPRERSI